MEKNSQRFSKYITLAYELVKKYKNGELASIMVDISNKKYSIQDMDEIIFLKEFISPLDIEIVRDIQNTFECYRYLAYLLSKYKSNRDIDSNKSYYTQLLQRFSHNPYYKRALSIFGEDSAVLEELIQRLQKRETDKISKKLEQDKERFAVDIKTFEEKIVYTYNHIDKDSVSIAALASEYLDELGIDAFLLYRYGTPKLGANRELVNSVFEAYFKGKVSPSAVAFNVYYGNTYSYIDYLYGIMYRLTDLRKDISEIKRIKYLTQEEKSQLEAFYDIYRTKYMETFKERFKDVMKEIVSERKKEAEDSSEILILLFLDSKMTIPMFCKEKDISEYDFRKALTILKELNNPVYEKYMTEMRERLSRNYAILLNKMKRIIESIKNGVLLEDGTKREFDIIDYYLITKQNPTKLANTLRRDLIDEELNEFYAFIDKNFKNDLPVSKIYEEKISMPTAFDVGGKPILDSIREIEKHEKRSVIIYLKSNNIPITQKTYVQGLKRFLRGTLSSNYDNRQDKNTKRL